MTEEVDAMLDEYFEFPEEVSLAQSGTPLEQIEQIVYQVPNFLTKLNLLKHLVRETETMERVLIFVNNKRIVDLVFETLDEEFSEQFGVIHSNKSQNYRLNTMAAFQSGELRGLVTTDIMARGLDISDLPCVINYDLPYSAEDYVHRIGRTGRAGAFGDAISLCSDKDTRLLGDIEKLIKQKLTPVELEGFASGASRADGRDAERGSDRNADRGSSAKGRESRSRDRQQSYVPPKEKIDPWFLKPYEASASAAPATEPVKENSNKTAQPQKRAALLGGVVKR
jgi:superfamily II DNA/RNA helicase